MTRTHRFTPIPALADDDFADYLDGLSPEDLNDSELHRALEIEEIEIIQGVLIEDSIFAQLFDDLNNATITKEQ